MCSMVKSVNIWDTYCFHLQDQRTIQTSIQQEASLHACLTLKMEGIRFLSNVNKLLLDYMVLYPGQCHASWKKDHLWPHEKPGFLMDQYANLPSKFSWKSPISNLKKICLRSHADGQTWCPDKALFSVYFVKNAWKL